LALFIRGKKYYVSENQNIEKEKIYFVIEQYTKHTNGELSTVDFVRSVGYKYPARMDI
jgi:hypothetical protein